MICRYMFTYHDIKLINISITSFTYFSVCSPFFLGEAEHFTSTSSIFFFDGTRA